MISESKCSAYLIVPWLGRTETDFLNCRSKTATNTKNDRILFFSSSLFFCFFLHQWHSFTFVFSFVSGFHSIFMGFFLLVVCLLFFLCLKLWSFLFLLISFKSVLTSFLNISLALERSFVSFLSYFTLVLSLLSQKLLSTFFSLSGSSVGPICSKGLNRTTAVHADCPIAWQWRWSMTLGLKQSFEFTSYSKLSIDFQP